MEIKPMRILIHGMFLFVTLISSYGFSDYVEGIDTTDVNGYGLDSAFHIGNYGNVSGIFNAYFFVLGRGYFNYAFDDIKMVPSIPKPTADFRLYSYANNCISNCIIVKNSKDSTYSKVQFLKQLSGNQYIYKYGTNTTPNNKMLIDSSYDKSIRYKPNNLYNLLGGIYDSTSWEPPLPNKNHLLGYIFYRPKPGEIIDTTVPPNPAQWDSISFIDSTRSSQLLPSYLGVGDFYFNLVAVYAEGKSDLLLGWTKYLYGNLSVKSNFSSCHFQNNKIEPRKMANGFMFSVQSLLANGGTVSLSICNLTGQQVAQFSNMRSNSIFWNTSGRNLSEGVYIVKAEFPDKSVLSQKFMFSR
jgi:hypothetical protein